MALSTFQENYNKSGDTPTSFYGKKRNKDWESSSLNIETGFSNAIGASNLINPSFLSTGISSDPSIMAFYVNALTYGNYTVGDILNDMKRRELISQGGANVETLKNIKIIDPEKDRGTYQQTAEGQGSVTSAASLIPTFNFQGLLNPEILKYGINMPDNLFNILVPIHDNTSQEFKDAVANVKSAYFDLANAQLQAGTEQEKAVADTNMEDFQEQINTKYGIVLSDDATKAWNQINSLENSFNTRGISGSGIENQAIDEYLQSIRKTDQRNRDQKLTEEESKKALYYTSSASSAEIAALTPEERTKYGLAPSADILAQYDMATLKTKYPNSTEEDLQNLRNAILDENGNYRSTLYKNYYTSVASNKTAQKTAAELKVETNAMNKENKAYSAYDYSSNNPLNIQPQSVSIEPTIPPKSEIKADSSSTQIPIGQTTEQIAAAKKAAEVISSNLSGGTQSQINPPPKIIPPETPTPTPTLTPTPSTNSSTNYPVTKVPSVNYQVTKIPPKKQYNTLYDYYTANGGWNTWNSTQRTADAKAAGLTGYSGLANENTKLLGYLNSR